MIRLCMISIMPILLSTLVQVANRRSVNRSEYVKKQYLVLCGLFVFFIFAFRHYSVGSGDGLVYYRNWEYMSTVPKEQALDVINSLGMEKGYLLFVWAISHVLKSGQYLFVVYAAIVSVSLCSFLKKNCDVLEVGFTMYICLGLWGFMIQGIRQGIAMCICLWAIEFVKSRKLLPFLITVGIATLFHGSAIVFCVVYFLSYLKIDFKSILITIIVIILSYHFMDKIFDLLNATMDDTYSIGEDVSLSGGFFTALTYILIIAIGLFTLRTEDSKNDAALFLYMTIIGLVAFVMRYYISSISQRVSHYFMFAQMILLPKEIRVIKKKYQFFIIAVVVLLCMGMSVHKSANSMLRPYIFFWEY